MKKFNLPREAEYREWNKQKVADLVLSDEKLQKYVTTVKEYVFNINTVAVYSFAKKPLAGKYSSVIFDKEDGIILCKISTSCILQRFAMFKLLGGVTIQKIVVRLLGYKYNNVLSLGHAAYFSMHGYTTGATDWACLHNMSDYSVIPGSIAFKTIALGGVEYIFSYDDCASKIGSRIGEALHHNQHNHEIIHIFLRGMGYRTCDLDEQSVLGNPDFQIKNVDIKGTCQDISDMAVEAWHLNYLKTFADEYGIKAEVSDHDVIYKPARRIKAIH